MPLVDDILASVRNRGGSEKASQSDVTAQMEDLMKYADEVRTDVCKALGKRYSSLNTALHDTAHLHQCVTSTLEDLTSLNDTIQKDVVNGLEGSVNEVGGVVRQWRKVAVGLEAANTLLTVHTLLDEAHGALIDHNFLISAHNLAKVEKLIEEASEKEIEGQLDLLSSLQENFFLQKTQLVYTIGEVWNDTVIWNEERHKNGSRGVTLVVRLLLNDSTDGVEKLRQMLGAMYLLGELQRRIAALGKNLMKNFFGPLINTNAEVKVIQRSDGYSLQVNQAGGKVEKAPAAIVFMRLQEIFKILGDAFLNVKVKTEDEEITMMHLLGKEIGKEFTDVLIKDCLAEAVPCSRSQLEDFEEVKHSTKDFQEFLVANGFYGAEDKSIIEYAANVDAVFSNKACAHLLDKARELMTRSVFVPVFLTPIEPEGHLILQDEAGRKLESSSLILEKLLAVKTFNLPKCQISASVCELVELIYETMEEACNSSPQYAGRLFFTVRNILTLYCHVVPTAHAHALATLPQQAAIVHNNSMYVAHHALLLGHQYKKRLPVPLRDNTLTTIDLAQQIRKMATSTFLKAMQGHRAALIDTLRESVGLDTLDNDSGAVNKAEQGMRQCLHQLKLLHRVWQNVLPHSVYTKSIGTLVGSVVEEVVTRVVSLEDISADAALALINLLNLLKDNVAPIFQVEGEAKTSPDDVVTHVRLWGKFCELIVILGASLRDILHRWSDGKGPLAHEFTPDEAKQLIRALFQNTDRRAQVLSKIK